jgi:hypothetical protein
MTSDYTFLGKNVEINGELPDVYRLQFFGKNVEFVIVMICNILLTNNDLRPYKSTLTY